MMSIVFPSIAKVLFYFMTNLYIQVFVNSDISSIKKGVKISS